MNSAEIIVLETDVFALFETLDTRRDLPTTLFDKNGKPYTAINEATSTYYGNENGMPQFLDAYFEQYCLNSKKSFVPLESIQDQLELVTDFPTVKSIGINASLIDFAKEKLMDLYLKGDMNALSRFLKANLSDNEKAYENLIVKRNYKIASKLDSLFKNKKSLFCAVGSGHFAGSEGLIRLLQSKGYRLRPVTWNISEIPIKAKVEVKSKNEFVYRHEESGLIAKFPGRPFERINEDKSITLKFRDLGQGNTYQIDILPIDSSLTFDETASIYIASPPGSSYTKKIMDDGAEIYDGLSDTYPEGLNWSRVQFGLNYFAVIKVYGGNKFMNSNRPQSFFNKVWFE
jgi:hypothetical protein